MILLGHGCTATQAMWFPTAESLAIDHRCVTWVLRWIQLWRWLQEANQAGSGASHGTAPETPRATDSSPALWGRGWAKLS
jgi:hypothetical protein